jgi:hypothetical protein
MYLLLRYLKPHLNFTPSQGEIGKLLQSTSCGPRIDR